MTERFAEHKWRHRLLLVFAGGEDDPKLAGQEKILEGEESGAGERDLVPVFSPGDEARREFGVSEGSFAALLVGKDGAEKARFERPVRADEIFRLIDEMPMRRREIGRGP